MARRIDPKRGPLSESGRVQASSEPDLERTVLEALDAASEGLQILGFDFRYLYVNDAAARHLGLTRERLLGRTLPELYPRVEQTELFRQLERCLVERTSHCMENELAQPDGESRWLELRMQPVPEGVLVFSIDANQRRRLEAELLHAQKSEALGRLAGGVAHDFNNLLTVILSLSEFVTSELPPGSKTQRDVRQISLAAERGARLTRQLLALSRRQVIEPRVLSINDAIEELSPMLQRLLGDHVAMRLLLSPTAGHIYVDQGQLDQVLMNLAANARDAMPERGKLSIRTESVTLTERYTASHTDVQPGQYVLVAVTDDGCGMDKATLARAFEPFFTTKGPGLGTGLGLATTQGIVEQHGGHLWVYSEPNRGTTVKIYFKRVSAEESRVESERPSPTPPSLRGDEVVLVVEDEQALRELCVRALRQYGYTTIEAETPSEAIHFAEKYSGKIHALLTDVIMPEMTGVEVAEKLCSLRPELSVVFMSGYAEHDVLASIDPARYLEKPFTPEALARRLREVLYEPSPD